MLNKSSIVAILEELNNENTFKLYCYFYFEQYLLCPKINKCKYEEY